MRATSLRDIMLADSLSELPNEISVIAPVNDKLVAKVLEQIGYDITQAWEYVPSKHKDLRNRTAIGYMVVGEYSRDKKYRHFLDTTDRVIVAGYTSPELARDMSALMGRKNIYKGEDKWEDGSRAAKSDPRYFSDQELLDMGWSKGEDEEEGYSSAEYIESDWEETLRAIKELEAVRDLIRLVK